MDDPTLCDLGGEIETRIDRGEPLQKVERYIIEETQDLPDDVREELVLYAWSWQATIPIRVRRKLRVIT